VEIVEALAEIGYDYIELSLSDLTALPEPAFASLVERVNRSGIRCEACNNFFPGAFPDGQVTPASITRWRTPPRRWTVPPGSGRR